MFFGIVSPKITISKVILDHVPVMDPALSPGIKEASLFFSVRSGSSI